jgi:hypothetical protein
MAAEQRVAGGTDPKRGVAREQCPDVLLDRVDRRPAGVRQQREPVVGDPEAGAHLTGHEHFAPASDGIGYHCPHGDPDASLKPQGPPDPEPAKLRAGRTEDRLPALEG